MYIPIRRKGRDITHTIAHMYDTRNTTYTYSTPHQTNSETLVYCTYMFLFLVGVLFESVIDTVGKSEIMTPVTDIARRKGWGKLEKNIFLRFLIFTKYYLFHVSDVLSATDISVVFGLGSHGNAL